MHHSADVRVICAAEYLKHIRSIGHRIAALREEIDEQRSFVELTGVGMDERVSSSVSVDKFERAAIELRELIDDYANEQLAYVEEQHDAHTRLHKMKNSLHVQVLVEYYLLGKSWEQICVDTSYSWQGLMTLRRKALHSFYDYIPEEYRRYSIPNAQV
jgi:hypothetical protein